MIPCRSIPISIWGTVCPECTRKREVVLHLKPEELNILETKWVASSSRYVKAAWEMLYMIVWILEELFRASAVRWRILERFSSEAFVLNLGIAHDALEEQRDLNSRVSKGRFFQSQPLVGQSIGRFQRRSEWLIDCFVQEPVETGRIVSISMLRLQQDQDELSPPFPFQCTVSQFTKLFAFTVSSLNENFSSPGQGGGAGYKYYKGILWALVRIVMPWWNKTWGLVQATLKHADSDFFCN